MKRLILFIAILFISTNLLAQTEGLSYQAVIINPNTQELPGENVSGNILPNTSLSVRFTITSSAGIEFQETHSTTTDQYGMINLMIGQGSSNVGSFNEIVWDGNQKDLKVEINLDGNYKDLSNQPLTFIPYAYHRDIIASGNLTIGGEIDFEGDLEVDGKTTLNNSLEVTNESPTDLSGVLNVEGKTTLNEALVVENGSSTNLSGDLTADGATKLNAALEVNGQASINNNLKVTGQNPTDLTGALTVDGVTNLNNALNVNNQSPVNISGDLNLGGGLELDNNLIVNGTTNLNDQLSVNNQKPTLLTGTLTIDGASNLNNSLNVKNSAPTNLSGILNVDGKTHLNNDVAVDGTTVLNNSLDVKNSAATNLSGILNVDGKTHLNNDVTVDGTTVLNNSLDVKNGAVTNLTGDINVDGQTNLNNKLNVDGASVLNNTLDVANGSATNLSGDLNVDGKTKLNNTLDVQGASILNNTLDVVNGSTTNLSGLLNVEGVTSLNNDLGVNGNTNLNRSLSVNFGSPTKLTGKLNVGEATSLNKSLFVNGATTLNNTLHVKGALTVDGPSTLSTLTLGDDLTVNGITNLNNSLFVNNAAPTNLSGLLNVELATDLKNTLNVNGATDLNNTLTVDGATDLKNTLNVDGHTDLNNTLTVDGATLINNNLTVTGNTTLENLDVKTFNIKSDNDNYIATFENENGNNGDGLLIKLGRTHGAWNNGSYLNLANPAVDAFDAPLNTIKGWLNGGSFTPTQLFDLMPAAYIAGAMAQIGNGIIGSINDGLRLPYDFPAITIPYTSVTDPILITNGIDLDPLPIDIPKIEIPGIYIPEIPILPAIPNVIPRIPQIPTGGLPSLSIPNFTVSTPSNSLSKENEYITFQDKDGRTTGTIRAQSTQDFRDNTVLDNVYLLNVLSSFVGIDLLDGMVSGTVEITNLIDAFNKIGVEYSSGHGDYAEWLERIDVNEFLTAGDIVAVKGGKITRDLNNVEQIMVVSHKPIILGNAPREGEEYKGNNIAFMGQVPVKVMGPVTTGDYIVANSKIKGYGIAIHPNDMTPDDFVLTVGRSWENNLKQGPKMINTVVGVHNGDFAKIIKKLEQKQKEYENKFKNIEARVNSLNEKADELILIDKNN